MLPISFNHDWTYCESTGNAIFDPRAGQAERIPVTLPHDAMIHERRSADAASGTAKGYYPNKDYDYYKTSRGYHPRSLNSNGGWNVIGCESFLNMPQLTYSNEIRSAVLIMHGEKAHSFYFGREAYEAMIKGNKYTSNKEFLPIPDAVHTDLYDGGGKDAIPFDKLESFFNEYLK